MITINNSRKSPALIVSAVLVLFLSALLAQLSEVQGPPEFYVSATGTSDGSGSSSEPWDLATALAHPQRVEPGSTIWIRSGVYRGLFKSELQGTVARPITVRVEPGGRATIDTQSEVGGAGLTVTGADTIYWGLEIMSSSPERVAEKSGSHSTISRADGVGAFGTRNRYVNMIVHDTRQGFGFWSAAIDSEIYGTLIYHNGWTAPDRGHGHGVYAQNRFGVKKIEDSIHYAGYGMGFRIYGTDAAFGKGFRFLGNLSVQSGALEGGPDNTWANYFVSVGSGAEDVVYEGNHSYYRPSDQSGISSLGYVYGPPQGDVHVKNNYWIGGAASLALWRWREAEVIGNTFYSTSGLFGRLEGVLQPPGATHLWNGNRYFGAGAFRLNGSKLSFDQWREETGFDESSTLATERPSEPWIFVRPNRYEDSRANIIVYNWPRQDNVDVDLSSVLDHGNAYVIRDALNYFGPPVQRGVYDGRLVQLPMRGLTTAAPIGRNEGLPHTGPDFGAFIVTADF